MFLLQFLSKPVLHILMLLLVLEYYSTISFLITYRPIYYKRKIGYRYMLCFQVLLYVVSLLLLSYHYLQLIPDIYRIGLVLGASSQFVM